MARRRVAAPTLNVSPDLRLPLDAVTETFWWSGTRGSGKTHDCSVFVEELLANGLQVVVIDPMRAWWGLRSSVDGGGPGFGIPIFGGPRGDVPLESTAGAYMADLAMAERVSMILDVKDWSKAELRRFVAAFLERLLGRNADPLHLVVEETPIFAPQKPQPGDQAMLGVVESVVRLGRGSGLGFSAISQRSAHLNAEVRAQIEVVVAHRTAAPLDRKAIRAWFEVHDPDRVAEAMARLPFLATGTAIVSSTEFLSTFAEVAFRARTTFDSSATPKVGQVRSEARTLADVDLAAITEAMAATIERAKADDPKELRARIAMLEKELKSARKVPPPQPEIVVERVEVPVLDEALMIRLEEALQPVAGVLGEVQDRLRRETATGGDAIIMERRLVESTKPEPARGGWTAAPRRAAAQTPPASSLAPSASGGDDPHLKAGARRIVETLARHYPMSVTRAQVGVLTGFKVTGGTFGTYWSQIKRAGLVDESGGEVTVTPAGLAFAGVAEPNPMSTEEMLEMWRGALKKGARDMLDVLVARYPHTMTREALADAVAMEVTGGTFGTYLATLRRNGLVDVDGATVSASDTLFIGGRS